MQQIWVEEFRPKSIDTYVFRDQNQRKTIEGWIKDRSIPHVLLTGGPGVGKSTLAHVLIAELEIENGDVLWINASRDNGIETIRRRITQFSETMPWGDFKLIVLDECLDENTLVVVLEKGEEVHKKIKDLLDSQLVKSFNVELNRVEWKPLELFDKGERDDVLEIEFEDGEVVICTPEHKWYVHDEKETLLVVPADQLKHYGHVMSPE